MRADVQVRGGTGRRGTRAAGWLGSGICHAARRRMPGHGWRYWQLQWRGSYQLRTWSAVPACRPQLRPSPPAAGHLQEDPPRQAGHDVQRHAVHRHPPRVQEVHARRACLGAGGRCLVCTDTPAVCTSACRQAWGRSFSTHIPVLRLTAGEVQLLSVAVARYLSHGEHHNQQCGLHGGAPASAGSMANQPPTGWPVGQRRSSWGLEAVAALVVSSDNWTQAAAACDSRRCSTTTQRRLPPRPACGTGGDTASRAPPSPRQLWAMSGL